MFEVGTLRKAEIEIEGESLAHFFAELNDAEYIQFSREYADAAGDGAMPQAQYFVMAYNARCRKVEGYLYNGVDIMSLPSPIPMGEGEGEGTWRDFIPAAHKQLAIVELLTGDRAKKKLSTNSTGSETSPKAARGK